ncbi:MAG TPA: J domain-containing protein [Lysobacter sp.]
MSQDFALLYLQLGLHPDCSLEDLKRAYRVRVAELHPDRHIGQSSSDDARALTELTALYSGAIRFHRIHGRLPGAAPRTAPALAHAIRAGRNNGETLASPHAARAVATMERTASASTTPKVAIFSVLALVVVMVALHWSESGPPSPAATAEAGDVADAAPDAPRLELGMEEAAVVAIQGPPERVQDGVWNYGSSWVRFEDGHVADWASVPPNRLMTATPRPVRDEEAEAAP